MNERMLFEALIKALDRTHRKLCAQNGTIVIDDIFAHTGLTGTEFIAMTDTVISVCTGTDPAGNAIDFKSASFNWVTIKAGIPIIAPDGYIIKAITLTSGSIALY